MLWFGTRVICIFINAAECNFSNRLPWWSERFANFWGKNELIRRRADAHCNRIMFAIEVCHVHAKIGSFHVADYCLEGLGNLHRSPPFFQHILWGDSKCNSTSFQYFDKKAGITDRTILGRSDIWHWDNSKLHLQSSILKYNVNRLKAEPCERHTWCSPQIIVSLNGSDLLNVWTFPKCNLRTLLPKLYQERLGIWG